MTELSLTELVEGARDGNQHFRDDVLRNYLNYINDITYKIWWKLNDETNFEQRCFRQLNYCIDTFDRNKGNPDSFIKKAINNAMMDELSGSRNKTNKEERKKVQNESQFSVEEDSVNPFELIESKSISVEQIVLGDGEEEILNKKSPFWQKVIVRIYSF